jgi:large subunit ribosomal protein L9e
MRCVNAHFPINPICAKDGKSVEIKNFLGGKKILKIPMLPGCTVKLSAEMKDEIILDGIDNQNLSITCAQISQSCKIGDKDDRKFLDGIYVASKAFIDSR